MPVPQLFAVPKRKTSDAMDVWSLRFELQTGGAKATRPTANTSSYSAWVLEKGHLQESNWKEITSNWIDSLESATTVWRAPCEGFGSRTNSALQGHPLKRGPKRTPPAQTPRWDGPWAQITRTPGRCGRENGWAKGGDTVRRSSNKHPH